MIEIRIKSNQVSAIDDFFACIRMIDGHILMHQDSQERIIIRTPINWVEDINKVFRKFIKS